MSLDLIRHPPLPEADPAAPGAGVLTRRLALRRPEPRDALQVARLADDARVAADMARLPFPYRQDDAAGWIAAVIDEPASGFEWVMEERATGRVVGAIGVVPFDDDRLPMFGYWLGAAHAGKGFATEAAHAALDHAFTTMDAPGLVAFVRVANAASRRVLEKCAFQPAGTGMLRSTFHGSRVSVDRYQIDRSVWRAVREWGRGA